MKCKYIWRSIVLVALFIGSLFLAGCSDDTTVQYPTRPETDIYVVDSANIINDKEKQEMLSIGKDLDQKYGAQIVVVTIKDLQGKTIEEYANNLFRDYGIGDKNKNNGVLFLISKGDRKCRIEVGYGLEGAITDGKAGQIIKDIKPDFKNDQYSVGTLKAYKALSKEVYKEYGDSEKTKELEETKDLEKPIEHNEESTDEDVGVGTFVFLFLMILLLIYVFIDDCGGSGGSSSGGGYYGGSSSYGGYSGGSSWGGGSSGGGGASGDW